MEKNYRELIIVIAEDDDGHAELIREGLVNSGVCNQIIRFSDGLQTWNFISGEEAAQWRNEGKVFLLLLDINMPVMDGTEVLSKIKSNENLHETLVIMLTTTDDPREIDICYKLGCNMYITKPVQFDKFAETLRRMGLFIQIIKV